MLAEMHPEVTELSEDKSPAATGRALVRMRNGGTTAPPPRPEDSGLHCLSSPRNKNPTSSGLVLGIQCAIQTHQMFT